MKTNNPLLNQLFTTYSRTDGELEVVEGLTGDTLSTGVTEEHKINDLFNRIDMDKTNDILGEDEPVKKKFIPSRPSSRRKSGLINEDYLRTLIREEMGMVMDEYLDEITEQITYTLEKVFKGKIKQKAKKTDENNATL